MAKNDVKISQLSTGVCLKHTSVSDTSLTIFNIYIFLYLKRMLNLD